MEEEDKENIALVTQLYKAVKKIGSRKLERILYEVHTQKTHNHSEKIKFICHLVSAHYSVPFNELFKSGTKGTSFDARRMCYILIHKHTRLTTSVIGNEMGLKSHSGISKAINEFKRMDESIKFHREFIDAYKHLDNKIINHAEKV